MRPSSHVSSDRYEFARYPTVRAAIGTTLALPVIWAIVDFLLASDRGIDLTDESLYLLDADPPSRYDALGFPYGWITGPLFQAVDYDIARFRTLGGMILVLATALLAHQILRFAAETEVQSPLRDSRVVHALTIGLVALSGLLYYVGLPLLRAPSYNWLNLVGILISLSGVFLPCRVERQLPAVALLASGIFLAVHAKPTTPFLLALAAIPLLVKIRGTPTTLRLLGMTIGAVSALVILAWLSPLWPADPISPFLRAV